MSCSDEKNEKKSTSGLKPEKKRIEKNFWV